MILIDDAGGFPPIRAVAPKLGKTALLPSEAGVASHSCRLVDLIPKLL